MQVTVKNNQSIVDIAIEYLGSANYAVDICSLNGISLTDYLEPGMNLILPEVKKTGNNTPAPAVQSDVDLKNIVTQHAAKIGGSSIAHVRNGGNVRIDADGRMWVEITQSSAKIKRHNFVGDISYCGTAPVNSTEASTNWSLTKIEISASGVTTVTRAIGSWNNHLTANYN